MATATMTNTPQDTIRKDKADVLELIAGMAKARYEKSVQALAAPYAKEAAIYNLAPPLAHWDRSGRDAGVAGHVGGTDYD